MDDVSTSYIQELRKTPISVEEPLGVSDEKYVYDVVIKQMNDRLSVLDRKYDDKIAKLTEEHQKKLDKIYQDKNRDKKIIIYQTVNREPLWDTTAWWSFYKMVYKYLF